MKTAEPLAEEISLTTGGIPIRNLWHMLLYAWNEVVLKNQWQAEAKRAPSLDALLASILAKLVQQRLRIGLGRSYTNEARLLRGIRGRVDFTTKVEDTRFLKMVRRTAAIRFIVTMLLKTRSFPALWPGWCKRASSVLIGNGRKNSIQVASD